MAKVLWRIDPPTVIHVFDKDPGPDYLIGDPNEPDTANHRIVEYDYDSTQVHFANLKLSADESTLEQIESGLTYAQQEAKYAAERETAELDHAKKDLKNSIRAEAGLRLERFDWKEKRAREQDLLNGNSAAMTSLASEKQAIRDQNNAACTEVDALSSLAEAKSYNPRGWGTKNYGA